MMWCGETKNSGGVPELLDAPKEIRTPVLALKGPGPGPLDDWGEATRHSTMRRATPSRLILSGMRQFQNDFTIFFLIRKHAAHACLFSSISGYYRGLSCLHSLPGPFCNKGNFHSGPTAVCAPADRKSTRLNSSHVKISYAVFCLKKKKVHRHISITAV